ncbi:MAG: Cof-type HAD-IIB family hydrolase [Eubacteriales bacterium]|nr:Cof-type HAD-IIB family hydrolase [Eubacteriales bacterium]
MYKIITCDLDETLLCMDRTISRRNIDAIHAAMEKGVKFVCASGRGYMSFQNTLQEIGLYDLADQYSISFNGSAITENRGNRVLFLEGISWELANALYVKGVEFGVCMHIYTQDTVYIYKLNEDERKFLENRMDYILVDDPDLSFLKGQQIIKVLYEHNGYDYLNQIEEKVAELTGECEVSYSSGRYLEFNKAGISKGAGLERLAGILGVDMKDTLAIGDNVNDITMIRAAGLGAAVGNVYEGIRGECDYIAEATNDEGGVGEIIEKFVL